jgi:hypothetical protein
VMGVVTAPRVRQRRQHAVTEAVTAGGSDVAIMMVVRKPD